VFLFSSFSFLLCIFPCRTFCFLVYFCIIVHYFPKALLLFSLTR
jgi:hypothetical protein